LVNHNYNIIVIKASECMVCWVDCVQLRHRCSQDALNNLGVQQAQVVIFAVQMRISVFFDSFFP